MSEGGHQAPGVDLEERLGLLVRIHFDVLIGYAFYL